MLYYFEKELNLKMEVLDMIKKFVRIIERAFGADVIIYDECNLFEGSRINDIPAFRRWHTNPYCLKIKRNDPLRKRCQRLKRSFVKSVLRSGGVAKSTCFSGVTEYVLPVFYKEHLLSMVAITGFEGRLHEATYKALSSRLGLSLPEFMRFREASLKKADDEALIIEALEILAKLLGDYIMTETGIPSLLDNIKLRDNSHILKAKEYITKNFTEPITLASVAEHCHISKSHLKHLFLKTIGHGVAEEIRLCRLSYAKELLCTTDHSVKYISFLCGFTSSDYFSVAFRKQFNSSPLRYRRSKRGEPS